MPIPSLAAREGGFRGRALLSHLLKADAPNYTPLLQDKAE